MHQKRKTLTLNIRSYYKPAINTDGKKRQLQQKYKLTTQVKHRQHTMNHDAEKPAANQKIRGLENQWDLR